MRIALIFAVLALGSPAGAAQAPRGYAWATVYAKAEGEAHSRRLAVPRKYCSLNIPAFTEDMRQASVSAVCDR